MSKQEFSDDKLHIWQNPIHFIASGFGAGSLPVMPGTYATLFAVPFVFLLNHFSVMTYFIIWLVYTER